MGGAHTLSEYPHEMVGLECRKCNRRGSFSKARLLAEHGDIGLPDLRSVLITDCKGKSPNFPCVASFTGMDSFLPREYK
jgi:hypothetical protein